MKKSLKGLKTPKRTYEVKRDAFGSLIRLEEKESLRAKSLRRKLRDKTDWWVP